MGKKFGRGIHKGIGGRVIQKDWEEREIPNTNIYLCVCVWVGVGVGVGVGMGVN